MLILVCGGKEPEMESMNLVKQFMKAMSRFRKMDYSVLHPGAGNGEFAALELISCHSRQQGALYGIYVSELLKVMDVSAPALSRLLRSMEQKGLCVREIDPDDRRSTCVHLTPAGQLARDRGHTLMLGFASRVVDGMGEEEFRQMIALWNRFGDVMESEISALKKGD